MHIKGTSVEDYLKALALVRNRLGTIIDEDDSDLLLLTEDLYPESLDPNVKLRLSKFLSLQAAFTAVILEEISSIDGAFNPYEYLNAMIAEIFVVAGEAAAEDAED